jgi:putative peptidoglycan lipid II flippase
LPSAFLVGAGIFLSRLAGLVRLRVFAYYFGLQSDAADAFNAAFRIPNILQNLFGEGALSGSFIPVYAGLLARGDKREAGRVAGAVAALLALLVSLIVLLGVFATPALIGMVAPGFTGEKRELTIRLVRILFPGMGLLVLSAWCLGVLNSHGRFLLSYTAPILWNAAMIATLVIFGGGAELPSLAVALAWGSLVGSALQFGVQVAPVVKTAPDIRLALELGSSEVRSVVRNFAPVFVSRGVVQLSSYIDLLLASLLPTGAVTGLTNAQLLYTLPVSLFGMSVAAAELPALSGDAAIGTNYAALRARLDAGLRQIAFFVVPSAAAFLALGDVVAGGVLQTGRFRHEDAVYVWGILAGSAVGLLAQTLGRLYSSTYYAIRDPRTPLRYALVRFALTTALGYVAALYAPGWLGLDQSWGAAGLTSSAGVAGWVEMLMLRRTLNARIGPTGIPAGYLIRLWGAAATGAAVGWALKLSLPALHPMLAAVAVLGPFGLTYFGVTMLAGLPEAATLFKRRNVRT